MEEERNLSELFTDGWKKFNAIHNSEEPSNSDKVQQDIVECQKILIKCTQMVNMLALFSKNETLADVSTENLKFFLVPVFLGELSSRLTSIDRDCAVNNARTYLNDFLKRCFDYGLLKTNFSEETDEAAKPTAAVNNSREEKIKRFKENKEINSRIQVIEKRLAKDGANSVDEDTLRKFYIDWLKLWVNNSVENLNTLKSEVEILQHMQKIRQGKVKAPPKERNLEPMKPILITREMIRNNVFGAGYRSLPTMTEDEYFEKELREGKIVQEFNPNQGQTADEDSDKHSSDEDEEKLEKARQWDDWKDTHRRGDGNKERHG